MTNLWHCFKVVAGMLGKRKAFTGPFWVQIGISNPCNHRCIMCWDHPSYTTEKSPYPTRRHEKYYRANPQINRDKGFMHLGVLQDLVFDLQRLGTRRIELVGRGEPTLHPKFDLIVELLKKQGFNVGVATNGSFMSRKRCEHLVHCGLDRIIVSLNAGTRETYPLIHTTEKPESFDTLIRNLKILYEIKQAQEKKRPVVILSFVISRINCRQGAEMIECGKAVGADQIVFKYVVPYPKIAFLELTKEEKHAFCEDLSALLRLARDYGIDLKLEPPIGDVTADPRIYHKKTEIVYSKIPCYVGWYFTMVTAEGTVIPCCQCMVKMGDLNHQSFLDIWRSDRYTHFREKMKRFPEHHDNPMNCACDQCDFEKINTTIYNKLHFYNPLYLYDAQREFRLVQILAAILKQRGPGGAKVFRSSP